MIDEETVENIAYDVAYKVNLYTDEILLDTTLELIVEAVLDKYGIGKDVSELDKSPQP